jgi:hypothetical protein
MTFQTQGFRENLSKFYNWLYRSVLDTDPSGPPGSGSVIICTDPDPGPSIKKENKCGKTMIYTIV